MIIIIALVVILAYLANRFFRITPLVMVVGGGTFFAFYYFATYYKGIDIEEINYDNLRVKRLNMPRKQYLRFLKRAESCLTDKIIERAERGKGRARGLEMKMMAVQKELERFGKKQ